MDLTTPDGRIEEEEDPIPGVAPRSPLTTRERVVLLAVLSLFFHVPLYFGITAAAEAADKLVFLPFPPNTGDFVKLRQFAPPEEPRIPDDAIIVATPAQEHIADAKPVDTKLLSDKTTRTEKETRSEVVAPADKKSGNPDLPKPEKPSVVQSPSSKSTKPTAAPKKSDKVELAAGGMDVKPSDTGKVRKSTMTEKGSGGSGTGILLPSATEGSALANFQALGGGEEYTSNDYLEGMDRGRKTVLNANQYRYADFFQRVKGQVEKHWRPSEAYLRRDPNGQAYGVKDRYTVLRVELDKGGKVTNITTWRQSGLDFMDEEAKRAFRAANPFLNPPLELLDADGKIRFEFGFYFEITGGKYRFNWKRL